MSSSNSTSGLHRTRSLRQPTAGLGRAQNKDEDKKDAVATKRLGTKDQGAVVSTTLTSSVAADPRTMSPSRLPKPGAASSTATRSRTGTLGSGIQPPSGTTAANTRSRPISGIFGLSKSSTVAAPRTSTQSTVAEQAPSAGVARPRPISTTSRLSRPVSMISTSKISPISASRPSSTRPTSATSNTRPAKPDPPRTTLHDRTKSKATSLTSATTLRPPRPPSAGSKSTTTTTATANTKQTIGRANTIATRTAPQRHTSSASSSANTPLLSSTGAAKPTTKTTAAAADDPPRLRPAFNTLQQHYSPARNLAPKPLTSTYLAPPTPSKHPANIALLSETARLQTELLQLHLLHRDADATAASWHASARTRLGRRFKDVEETAAVVEQEEARAEESKNVAVLVAWGGQGLEERVQMLDSVVSGVWSVGEPGGRYARVVKGFEKWMQQMQTAVEARRQAGGLGALMEGGEVAFIGDLDAAWRDEVCSLTRKLDGWRRQLAHLEQGLPGEDATQGQDEDDSQRSSLSRILAGCRSQVHDMLAELDIMEQIEREAISQEAAWIRRVNRDGETDDTPRAGAVWRVY